MKSKYNTGVPIDINELSEEEIKTAFHEWAEGSEALEKLLNEGYDRGFISHACCGGDTGNPYIAYELNDENSRKMAIEIAQKLVDSDLNCQISFNHDFWETEEEYKKRREHLLKTFPEDFKDENYSSTRTITGLNVCTKMENREEVFGSMAKYVKEAELESIKLPESKEEVPDRKFNENIEERIWQSNKREKMIEEVINESKKNIKQGEINSAIVEIKEVEQNYIREQSNPKQFTENEPAIGG